MIKSIRDKMAQWIAYLLPWAVLKWASVRVFAETSFLLSEEQASEITFFDAMKMVWERKDE